MAGAATDFGQVRSQYGLARRVLLPIYGLDQLLTVVIFGILLALLCLSSGWDGRLAAVGAYLGFIAMMWRATPCRLLLPSDKEAAVVALLDGSRLIKRTALHNEWRSRRGRLRRWHSDTIRLVMAPGELQITGQSSDLSIIAQRVAD